MNSLDELYIELHRVENMTEAQVIEAYNADSKEEIIELIREDIQYMKKNVHQNLSGASFEEDFDPDDALEEERTAICLSQGLSRYC